MPSTTLGPSLRPARAMYFEGDQFESALIAIQIWALLSASNPRWLPTCLPSGGASEASSNVTRNSLRYDEAGGDWNSPQNDQAGPKTPPQSGCAPQPGRTRSGIPKLDHNLSEVDESQLSDDGQSSWSDVLDWVQRYSKNIERKVFPRSSGWEELVVDRAPDKSLTTDVGRKTSPTAAPMRLTS